MKKEIVIAVVSSLISAVAIYVAGSTYGIFKERLSSGLISDVASEIVTNDTFQNFILDEIEKNPTKFQGEVGPEGQQGKIGPQGITGLQGERGEQGDRGETGPIGECPLPRVIAALYVKNGQLVSSSPGVTYNTTTGVVSFPNHNSLDFIPIVTDASAEVGRYGAFMTRKHFIDITFKNNNQFKVRATSLDTGERAYEPTSFSAIVVGVKK